MHVNLNEIEANFKFGRIWNKTSNHLNEINVGSSLDPNYIYKAIVTTSSVIASQNNSTKLRLHFSVVKNFTPQDMLKIYSLRANMREDVEFNFYNASRVEKELNSISKKGPGLAAKLLLPQLVDDSVDRLILLDNGDVIVLNDLSTMYNWDMKNNIYMGAPDQGLGRFGNISNHFLNVYINVGHYLIDVKKVKKKDMYSKFLKYKNIYGPPFAEQHMINDIAYGEIGYLPIEYGLPQPFEFDNQFNFTNRPLFKNINLKLISKYSNFLPKTYEEFVHKAYSSIIVHSWYGKWADGRGMNIYRKLCQYFIELSGMKKEICNRFPGYCIYRYK